MSKWRMSIDIDRWEADPDPEIDSDSGPWSLGLTRDLGAWDSDSGPWSLGLRLGTLELGAETRRLETYGFDSNSTWTRRPVT
ncbi:UNVERIFIED_CONTAM: hypothetical protein FKN15_009888 [Acipenser sinensis]